MKLPTSKASPDPSSPSISSASLNADSTHSFSEFLDLISPSEFSKLLRARVRHLLTTWPPQCASSPSTSASNPSFRPEHSYSPKLESIQAFATFFRSQDSPPPSPTDNTVAASLSILHHHLLALQTLLSFLSGRELKEIVRARLAEGGKDKSLAIQGLMDVMQNPAGGAIDVLTEAEDQIMADQEDDVQGGREGGITGVGTSLGHITPSLSGRHKVPTRSVIGAEAAGMRDTQPPKKRQRLDPSGMLNETSMVDKTPAAQRASSSSPNSQGQAIHPPRLAELPTINSSNSTDLSTHIPKVLPNSWTTNGEPQIPSDASDQPISHPSNSVLKSEDDLLRSSLGRPPEGNNCETALDTDVELPEELAGEGLVVTLLEDEAPPTSGLPDISSMRSDIGEVAPASTYPIHSTLPLSATESGVGHIQRRFSPEKGKQSSVLSMEEEESKPHVSEEEQRLRAEFGIPLRKLQDSEYGQEPRKQFEDTINAGCENPRSMPVTDMNENAIDASSSSGALFPADLPASPPPGSHVSRSRSRSRSRSFPRSASTDRASPPGPMLRTAVDWASGVSSVTDGGSDDTLTFRPSAVFDPENDNDTISAGMFAPKAFARSPGDSWEGGGARISDAETSVVDGREPQPRKLFIRLPARPRNRLTGPGVASEGSIASTSASARVSPAPERSAKKSSLTSARELHPTDEVPRAGALRGPRSAPGAPKSASVLSPTLTPAARSTPNIVAPHAQYPIQYPPGSRPQSGSPGTLAHGHGPYAIAQHAYPQPQHPYPGPWFGAMFYVPLHGHPHSRPGMQALQKMPPGPSRQASDVTGSAQDQGSGSSASASAPGSSCVQPPSFGGRKVLKLPEPEPPRPVSPPPPVLDPDVTYTDDIGVKESPTVKRRCFNCRGIQAPSWRKSKLTFGKILCNKCGIYESTHMTARPLKTRPRRSLIAVDGEGGTPKKRKTKKQPAVP